MPNEPKWLLTGKIDRIDLGNDGVPTVVDYKSGKPGDEETASRSLQLKIYARVATQKFGADTVRTSLHWLQNASSATVTWSAQDVQAFDAPLTYAFEGVEGCCAQGHFGPRPSPFRCRSCAYRLICPERVAD